LRAASVDLRDTVEFQALIATGAALTKGFIKDAVAVQDVENLDFNVDFIVLLVTSVAERTTDEGTSGANLIRQADLLTDMLIPRFGIC
jgi:hypothetical protein